MKDNKINKKSKIPEFNFKPLKLDESGAMTIGLVQSSFESFWKQLNKVDGSKNYKIECLKKLKEACYWMSRSVAEYHELENTEE